MTLNQSRRQARSQRVGKQPAGRGLGLQFGNERIGHLGQERVLEAVFVTQ